MQQCTTPQDKHSGKRKRAGIIALILLLATCGGFLFWKFLLPIFNQNNTSNAGSPMKIPADNAIQKTEKFGMIPVNQFGILLKDGLTKVDAVKIAEQVHGTVTGHLDLISFYQIETQSASETDFEKTFNQLRQTAGVELVSPNKILILDGSDETQGTCDPLDDPMYQDSAVGRHFQMIGLKNAYAFIKASGLALHPVKVAVMDTRIYKPCDELGGNINVSTTDPDDYNDQPDIDKNGTIIKGGLTHGTIVNEIIGADAGNGGVTGVASPLENKLTIQTTNIFKTGKYQASVPDPDDPSKVVDNGVTYVHTTLKAMLDQIKNGATVINCSFGPKEYDKDHSFETALYEKFYNKILEKYPKVVIVGSAGNSNAALNGNNGCNKGQKAVNLITVGALNPDGLKSDYSNYATPDAEVTLSAPADKMIHGMDNKGSPILASGTSFAAPQVSGTVALLQSINPDLTSVDIKNILTSTSDKIINGRNMSTPIPEGMGAGMLRVDLAVLKVINDLRVKKGLTPLSGAGLIEMNKVYLTYAGGPEDFKIKAEVTELSGFSAKLTLDISGNNYATTGANPQTMSAPGAANWSLTMKPDSKLTVKVSRSDTRSCAWVVIESVEFTGKWKISGKITSAKLDASLGTMKDMGKAIYGADEKEMDEGQKEVERSVIGKETPLAEIDVETWKHMGCKIIKEGSTIVITPPGADNPEALGSMIYYIDKISGDSLTGRAIARNNFGGQKNEIHFLISGIRVK